VCRQHEAIDHREAMEIREDQSVQLRIDDARQQAARWVAGDALYGILQRGVEVHHPVAALSAKPRVGCLFAIGARGPQGMELPYLDPARIGADKLTLVD